ncbi:MAG: hypothetical protein HW394_2017 [Acidobacteria bacterium]|nr:hypothetical protein [Acidobacteriota bacterium]
MEQRRNSPIEGSLTGAGTALPSNSASYGTLSASASRGRSLVGAPGYLRNGSGCVAQSRYPSDRAKRLK